MQMLIKKKKITLIKIVKKNNQKYVNEIFVVVVVTSWLMPAVQLRKPHACWSF